MNGRSDNKHIWEEAHNDRTDYSTNWSQGSNISSLIFSVTKLILKICWHPIIDAVVRKLNEEEREREGQDTGDAEGFKEWDILDKFIVFYLILVCSIVLLISIIIKCR